MQAAVSMLTDIFCGQPLMASELNLRFLSFNLFLYWSIDCVSYFLEATAEPVSLAIHIPSRARRTSTASPPLIRLRGGGAVSMETCHHVKARHTIEALQDFRELANLTFAFHPQTPATNTRENSRHVSNDTPYVFEAGDRGGDRHYLCHFRHESSGRILGANDRVRLGIAGINGRGGPHERIRQA